MTDRMWPLRWFRYDGGVVADQVYVTVRPGEDEDLMPREEAVTMAHERGLNLIPEWPEHLTTGAPTCRIGKVTLPVRWEQLDESPPADLDQQLWFEAPCGGRDILTGSGNTFPGRMEAWCPDAGISYNVSLSEMGPMSEQARYWVAGFLAGNQRDAPEKLDLDDGDSEINPDDVAAWQAATARFRSTGFWHGRWRTCEVCGRVLLPDAAADRCKEHSRANET